MGGAAASSLDQQTNTAGLSAQGVALFSSGRFRLSFISVVGFKVLPLSGIGAIFAYFDSLSATHMEAASRSPFSTTRNVVVT